MTDHANDESFINEGIRAALISMRDELNLAVVDVARLASNLDELECRLQQEIQRQVEHEFEEVIFRAPWLTAQAEEVKRQSHELLTQLQHMSLECRQSLNSAERRRQFCDQFDCFAEDLLQHAAAEQQLLFEAYQQADSVHD